MADLQFYIRPLEPLFFGPPHSISAGETHHLRSLFPPPVSAFQGLIRSAILHAVNTPLDLNDFSKSACRERATLVGTPDELPPGWQFHGPYPAHRSAEKPHQFIPWLPVPRLLFGDGKKTPCYAHWLDNAQGGMDDLSDNAGHLLGRPERDAVDSLRGWCSVENLHATLRGSAESEWSGAGYRQELPPFVAWDGQAGLALDRKDGDGERKRSVTARHGMLYFQQRLRLKVDSGFIGGLSGQLPAGVSTHALSGGTGTWGRKSRPVALTLAGNNAFSRHWRELLAGEHLAGFDSTPPSENDLFWLVTLTPVALEHSTAPHPRLAEGSVTFQCLAALPGPYVVAGGYDLASGSPRANRKLVPAGSAWLFRLMGGDPAARRRALLSLNNAFPLGPPQEAAFGYGHTLVGIAPPATDQTGEQQ